MTDSASVAPTDRQVLITRTFDAPRETVFAAWTDPDQVAGWYGPEGFDAPRDKVHIDPSVGGRWELTMVHRDSGAEHPVRYEIVEIVEPELLVLSCPPMPEVGLPEGTVTRVELHAHGDETRMTLTDGPYPAAGADRAEAGWNGAFDKLAGLVAAG